MAAFVIHSLAVLFLCQQPAPATPEVEVPANWLATLRDDLRGDDAVRAAWAIDRIATNRVRELAPDVELLLQKVVEKDSAHGADEGWRWIPAMGIDALVQVGVTAPQDLVRGLLPGLDTGSGTNETSEVRWLGVSRAFVPMFVRDPLPYEQLAHTVLERVAMRKLPASAPLCRAVAGWASTFERIRIADAWLRLVHWSMELYVRGGRDQWQPEVELGTCLREYHPPVPTRPKAFPPRFFQTFHAAPRPGAVCLTSEPIPLFWLRGARLEPDAMEDVDEDEPSPGGIGADSEGVVISDLRYLAGVDETWNGTRRKHETSIEWTNADELSRSAGVELDGAEMEWRAILDGLIARGYVAAQERSKYPFSGEVTFIDKRNRATRAAEPLPAAPRR